MANKKAQEFDALRTEKCEFNKDKNIAVIHEKDIKTIFVSKVRPFSNSGGYIPASEDYKHHRVYVVVMKK